MKNMKVLKVLGVIALLAAISLILDYVLGIKTYGELAMAVGATVVNGEPVTTTVTETQAPDLLLDNIDQEIVKIDPSRFPLDTCLRQMARVKKVESQTTAFYSRDYKPFKDAIPGNAAPIVGTGAETSLNIIASNISMWSKRDRVMLVGVPAYKDDNTVNSFASLVCFIYDINKTTSTLVCQPTNGFITGGVRVLHTGDTIAPGTTLIRLGRAESEVAMQTASYAIFPEKEHNYCQNRMAQIEQSTFDALSKKEVNWSWDDFSEANVKDMKGQGELDFLYGARAEIYDLDTNERIYTSGGATEFLTKDLEWSDTDFLPQNVDTWFVALTKKVFQGNSGSQVRYAFLGPDIIEKINAVPIVQKQLVATATEVKFGITFNEITSTFGTLRIVKHDLLGEVGKGDEGFIFDMGKVEFHKFIALHEKELDLQKAGTKNVQAKIIQEVACPVFKYPDCHLWLHKAAPVPPIG